MERTELTRNQLVNQLLHVGHGKLEIYTDTGLKAAQTEPELFGHMISWNSKKGEVRDSKVALPILALRGPADPELYENAVANLCLLDPRNLLKAARYHFELAPKHAVHDGAGHVLKNGIKKYLKAREGSRKWWDRTVLQHRKSIKSLYSLYHVKPSPHAQAVLFKKSKRGVFKILGELKNMQPEEAAGQILNHEIPFTIAVGALGGIKDKPDILLALIERMSGAELINNTKMLQRFGVFENSVLKSAYDNSLEKAKKDKRLSTLKAGKAKEVIKDKKLAAKMESVEEAKLDQLGGIEGDWAILGDRSGSMDESIEIAKQVAALIAQQIKGAVYLVFFDTSPTYYDVTGKSLSEIKELTKRIAPGGATAIGCSLAYLMDKNIVVNGIAICSDGGDNTHPLFHETYRKYCAKFGLEPPVYHFWAPGERNHMDRFCKDAGILVEFFDVSKDVDFYSLPNIIKTLRTSRYTLVEEIMETPLLTFNDVFQKKGGII
jgi:hypothetical protein